MASQHKAPQRPLRTVVFADDHKLVAEGLRILLSQFSESIHLVTSGEELIDAVRHAPPQLIISDISMPGISGIEAMKTLHNEGHIVPFLFLTMHDDPAMAVAAIRAGGRAFVSKASAGDELLLAIESIQGGFTFISPRIAANAISSTQKQTELTSRQLRILGCLDNGMTAQEIADELGVSKRTVESHKYFIMQELGVHSTLQLLLKARQLRLLAR